MENYWHENNLGNDLPVSTPLSRQGSIYSWTVDEFQTSLGKDCGSMNMDELVKNIFNAEETKEGLQRQGSLTLPGILSQKTVDEVWKYISEEDHNNDHGGGGTHIPQIQRQPTLGDTTLEDFLTRAGARGNNTNGSYIHDPSSMITSNPNTGLGGRFQQKAMVYHQMNNMVPRSHDSDLHQIVNGSISTYQPQQPIMSKPNGYAYACGTTQIGHSSGFMGTGDTYNLQDNNRNLVPSVTTLPSGHMTYTSIKPYPILDGIPMTNVDSSSISPSPYITSGSTSVRGRTNNLGIAVNDKKLRRKIKNRESAARSRARKQAQTMEIVVELENLKKEHEKLLRIHAEMSKLQTIPANEMINRPKRLLLRRTKSDIM